MLQRKAILEYNEREEPMETDRERRSAPRFTIDRMVRIELGSQRPVSARGINISVGGLLCRTEEPVDPLTRMRMFLSLPDDAGGERRLEMEGTVLHYRSGKGGNYDLGIHFDRIDSSARQVIGRYVARLSAEEEQG
jgi:c-di-GMP-binding flagellar brake protein YcgR